MRGSSGGEGGRVCPPPPLKNKPEIINAQSKFTENRPLTPWQTQLSLGPPPLYSQKTLDPRMQPTHQ